MKLTRNGGFSDEMSNEKERRGGTQKLRKRKAESRASIYLFMEVVGLYTHLHTEQQNITQV